MTTLARPVGHPRSAILTLILGSALAIPLAQASEQVLEEVTVTAQKRQQRQEDVGISVTALSGDQVRELGLRSLTDVAAQTPSLSVAAPGFQRQPEFHAARRGPE
ncbi:MAG: hypothetical protein U1F35_00145 [Steroidobacteraceae bacterium]